MLSVFWDDTRRVDLLVLTRTSVDKKPGLKRSAMIKQSKSAWPKKLSGLIELHSARCGHIPVGRRMGKSDCCYTTPRRRLCWAAYTGHEEWLAQTRNTKTKQTKRERGIATANLEDSEHTTKPVRYIHGCRSTSDQRDSLCPTCSLSQHRSFQGKFHCSSLISCQPGSTKCC